MDLEMIRKIARQAIIQNPIPTIIVGVIIFCILAYILRKTFIQNKNEYN